MTHRGANLVVGTAGHVDHGKTALVEVLTGVDLDALPEEKERGITIALGFAPLDLPDGRRAALVDVPGHERLVRTMVAGATGIDAVLLCVSAVEGVMPQTREHLAILDLLGVKDGAIVLTFADLVDEELLELATEDAMDAVAGTFLEGKPVLPFSAVTRRGADEVLAAMAGLGTASHAAEGTFRLPVDRSFVQPGFGTVVTGTVWSGQVHDGDQVLLLPQGKRARVRGIQVHGDRAEFARAGWRAALNLAGVDTEDTSRGTVVAGADVPCPHVIDVRYRHLPGAGPMDDGSAVRVLLGTAEAVGRLHVAADREVVAPGDEVYVQVRLDAPLPTLPGDRFVVRRPSPQDTLGGGVVLDPWAPRMRRRDRVRAGKELSRLEAGDVEVWLERAGEQGLTPEAWSRRAPGSDRGLVLGDRVLAPRLVGRLEGALLQAMQAYHAGQPLSLGAHRRELRRRRLGHLTDRMFDALVDRLYTAGLAVVEGPLVRLAGFEVALTAPQEALRDRVRATIEQAGLGGISPKKLHEAHREPEVAALVRLMEVEGTVIAVPGLGVAGAEAIDGLRQALRDWFADHEGLSPGQFKELTGLSRKGAIPLLEWLDATGVTRRAGDVRHAGDRLLQR